MKLLRSVLALAALVLASASHAQALYVQLDTPTGWDCMAKKVNAQDQLLVSCNTAGAFIWNPKTQSKTFIPPIPGARLLSYVSFNNFGQVVGNYFDANDTRIRYPFLWSASGGYVVLADPLSRNTTFGINDLGDVLLNNVPLRQTYIRQPGGNLVHVDVDPATYYVPVARLFNNLSEVVLQRDPLSVFRWSSLAGLVPYPDIPASVPTGSDPCCEPVPLAVTDAGAFVGSKLGTPFMYTPGGGYQVLQAAGSTTPYGMNEFGQVVGQSDCGSGQGCATWWRTPSERVLLPGPSNSVAAGINSSGVIAGMWTDDAGLNHPVAWLVPPPTTGSPAQAVAELIAYLGYAVGSGAVQASDIKGMQVTLDASSDSLQRGNATAARNMLEAFSRQLDALVRSGRMSAGAAATLQALVTQALGSF